MEFCDTHLHKGNFTASTQATISYNMFQKYYHISQANELTGWYPISYWLIEDVRTTCNAWMTKSNDFWVLVKIKYHFVIDTCNGLIKDFTFDYAICIGDLHELTNLKIGPISWEIHVAWDLHGIHTSVLSPWTIDVTFNSQLLSWYQLR